MEPQPPSLRDELSQAEEPELGFCPVRPGGGREGGATDRPLEGRGTFHSSWAREELDTEPPPAPPGDHLDSPGLAAGRTHTVMSIRDPHMEFLGQIQIVFASVFTDGRYRFS